jgi:D-sedoheptulose 7-phosphate isomerase
MIREYLKESIVLQKKVLASRGIVATFNELVNATLAVVTNGGKILVAGNGGSAADAQHFAAEFVAMYKIPRRAHAAIALTTDTSILTAVSNDYHFKNIFARQVEALGREGDILFLLSTSGNSLNLIHAIKSAKRIGVSTVSFLGKKGGKMKGMADYEIIIPSDNTPRIQEVQKLILHSVAEEVEKRHFATYLS